MSYAQIDQANAPCSTDESGFCARTIESGLYTCDEDYCSVSANAAIDLLDLPIHPPDSNMKEIVRAAQTCAQAHACDHSCSLPCVGQLGGPALGGAAGPPIQVCETDSSRMCDRTIAAGLYDCDTDYCLTCPQAHSCDNSCSLPCGETEDGHRRNLKTNGTTIDSMEFELPLPTTLTKLNKAAASSSHKSRRLQDYWQATPETNDALFDVAPINQIACPLSSFVDRAQEVEAQCCHGGQCPNGMPDDCAFDCGRFFTSFMVDCNQTIHNNFDRLTLAEYIAFGDECSRMDPLSMIRAIDGAFCTTCGDNITQAPLEQCDWGAGNSYEPNACRPDCQLPSCGDGVIDTAYPIERPPDNPDCVQAAPTQDNFDVQVEFEAIGAQTTWTVPDGVTNVLIYAQGARGGHANTGDGGHGAIVIANADVAPGQVLTIMVGTTPAEQGTQSSGGGGGTFIVRMDGDTPVPLAVAGGGGGSANVNQGLDASLTETGVDGLCGTSCGTGGTGGSGGIITDQSAAAGGCGGGLLTDGGHGNFDNHGNAFVNGGAMAPGCSDEGISGTSGFGGAGGSGNYGGGGGGGYSGGGGGGSDGYGGGGGGSYDASGFAEMRLATDGDGNNGHVTIYHLNGPGCARPPPSPPAELCDDGVANADEASCRNDCTRSCSRPPPVDGMTVSLTAGLAPGSVATFSCDVGQVGL